ncbi:MAG: adenylate/guanylate cyclase domain-containing protein [Deltaproteobacteria bacterium]|nr:adenylate/guanylate cyclase domain-containing protein [Deltaproteobacteria bacterium]
MNLPDREHGSHVSRLLAPPAEEQYAEACDRAGWRGELWVNYARGVLAVAGLVVLLLLVDDNTAAANAVLWAQDLVWLGWCAVVAWQLRGRPARAPVWLAPVSVAVDQLVVAGTYVAALANNEGVAEYWVGGTLGLFAVVNVLSGLRLVPWVSVFSACTTLAVNAILLAHSHLAGTTAALVVGSLEHPKVHLHDLAIAVLFSALPGFGVAMVAQTSRKVLRTAARNAAERQTIQEEAQRLAKYLPRQVVEVMMSDPKRRQLGGERRKATIVFVDIRDFTAMSQAMQPEVTVSVLNDFFAVMVEKLFSFDGTLDKFLGDGFMAVFGAPLGVDAPETRATLAAIAMVRASRTVAPFLSGGDGGLAIGIGIATGEVLSGTVGSPDRMEFTCIGPAVNLAARLEGLNKPLGTVILVDDATAQRLDPGILRRDCGDVQVRGLSGESHIWAIDPAEQDEAVLQTLQARLWGQQAASKASK